MNLRILKSFKKDTSGNFAATFAVGLMMLMVGVGAAIDFTGMSSKETSYQNMADAAILAAVRTGSSDHAVLLQAAQDVVDAHNTSGETLTTTMTFEADDRVRVYIKGTYDTVLMGLFGTQHAEVKVVSESILGVSGYINLVLVLDGTASMGYNSRLDNMKAAATQMITDLEDFESNKLKISVVPFSQYVNVGVSNRNKPWVDVPPDWIETLPEQCYNPVIGTRNCRMEPYGSTPPSPPGICTNDGVSYSCGGSSGSPGGSSRVCDNIYGPEICTNPTVLHTWYGIVGSRNSPWNERVNYVAGKKVPGFLDVTGNAEMLPLTSDLGAVKAKVASVSAVGETYMPSGLMWGWRALNRSTPFSEASATPADKVRNIMVFMTDGYNTKSLDGNTHNGTDRNDADDLTEEMCDKIKDDDIEIYSITYEVMDADAQTLVRGCATDNTRYYEAANGSELAKAFGDIGRSILSPRLTH